MSTHPLTFHAAPAAPTDPIVRTLEMLGVPHVRRDPSADTGSNTLPNNGFNPGVSFEAAWPQR